MKTEIDAYYAARQLVEPDATEALLWLLSEVGELAQAHLAKHVSLVGDAHIALIRAIDTGERAEQAVTELRGGWVRNNERVVTRTDSASEVADVAMMLDRYAKAAGLPEPDEALRAKIKRKLAK